MPCVNLITSHSPPKMHSLPLRFPLCIIYARSLHLPTTKLTLTTLSPIPPSLSFSLAAVSRIPRRSRYFRVDITACVPNVCHA
jgi:hypothetical protein